MVDLALSSLAERVAALHSRVGDLSEITSRNLVEHDGALEDLFERVSSLESSICHCPDCVMHREKARHGKPKHFAGAGNMLPAEPELPAWQRAKVGDLVQYRHRVRQTEPGELRIGTVIMVADTNATQRICVTPENEAHFCWPLNSDIVSILPPEPAAPVQDDHNIAGHAGHAGVGRSAAPMRDVPASLDALKAEAAGYTPTEYEHSRLCFMIDRAHALGRAESQPLTIDWNTALDEFHAASRGPHGTASDGVMAVLKLVPGLEVKA